MAGLCNNDQNLDKSSTARVKLSKVKFWSEQIVLESII